jgi:catechol 2,3-dioxygenase-like lactoylglutathione lyase family enzyme
MTAPHEAIPVLRVEDGPASAAWYRRLGFQEDWRHQHEPGFPWFISISTPQGATLFLSEHGGDCAPGGSVFLVTRDITAAEAALNMRAELMPWGDRELSLLDPDGNRVRVSQPAESVP